MNMKMRVQVIKLSFGQIDETKMDWANLHYLSDEIQIKSNSIGQEVAKMRVNPEDGNKLAKTIHSEQSVPGYCELEVVPTERGGSVELLVVGIKPENQIKKSA